MNQNNKVQRVNYLDEAKAVGIIFVVVFHVLGTLINTDEKAFMPYVIRYIVTIALPIFFIVSGMLFYYKRPDNKTIKEVAKRKAKGLLTPYVCFSIILIVSYIVRCIAKDKTMGTGTVIKASISFVTLRGFSVFWFLPVLFIAELIFTFLYKKLPSIVRWSVIIGLTALLIIICPIYSKPVWENSYLYFTIGSLLLVIGRTCLAMGFLLMGYMLMHIMTKYNPSKIISLIVGIALLVGQYFISYLVGGTNINVLSFGNSYFFFMSAIVGSYGVILTLRSLSDMKVLKYIGSHSLTIMVTHMDFGVLALSMSIAYRCIAYIPRAKVLCLYGMIFGIIAIVELILIFIFDRYLYKLLGQNKK